MLNCPLLLKLPDSLGIGVMRLIWTRLSSLQINCAVSNRVVQVIPKRCKWTPPNEKLRKDIEALARWRKENTRLFGPILKSKSIDPLGKKKRRRKSEKIVIGKDLDDWFSARYESNVPNKDVLQKKSEDESNTPKLTDESSLQDNTSESFKHEAQEAYTGDFIHAEVLTEKVDRSVLDGILQCKLTPDVNEHLDGLRSCLQRSPFPTMPTVSGILAKTRSAQSQFFLDRWKAQMIAQMGEEGFKKYQTETLQKGVDLHNCIQQYLSGVTSVQPQPDNTGHWASIHQVLASVQEVQALEMRVAHPFLNYAGTFDCVATYHDTLCLIDWKTSQKAKPHLSNTFDYPLQVCAYIGAHNADPANEIKVENGLVVVAYGDGSPAHAHLMTRDQCEYYWRQWLERLYKYWSAALFPDDNTNSQS